MEDVSYADLREKAAPASRRLGEALKKPGFRFVLECKKASPSEGLIRKNFDITEIANAYKGFADAVSVLTDEPYFMGGFEYLRAARAILDQPILAKDFVIGPYQVCEARAHGADAVLLMLSVLDDPTYRICAAEANRLSMDILTEAHSEAELKRALALDARIIGINNRNLGTLKVDLGVYEGLVGKIPSDRIVVCESGIQSHEDVLRFKNRTDAFLVGGSLMKSEHLDLAVRRLIYGGVKVCGLTAPEDAEKCYAEGATFGGMIFAESPRRVSEAQAGKIRAATPLPMAGVFVDEEASKIAGIASDLELSAVQLHGEESGDFIDRLREKLPKGCEIWKAIRVKDKISSIDHHADRVLLDTFEKGARGGTGRSFDWSLLDGLLIDRSQVILAGGIGPDNARRASEFGCFSLDVNSGVESSPGKKDHHKIENLFKSLRGEI
jgi:indole-3-glycerol phosphate synthase/phosphoribosylanthranilate isomerase